MALVRIIEAIHLQGWMTNKNWMNVTYLTEMENKLERKGERYITATDKNKQRCWIVFGIYERMMFEVRRKTWTEKENKNQIKSAKHGWRKSTVAAAALILLIGEASVTTEFPWMDKKTKKCCFC